jgi:hypothetical protein
VLEIILADMLDTHSNFFTTTSETKRVELGDSSRKRPGLQYEDVISKFIQIK